MGFMPLNKSPRENSLSCTVKSENRAIYEQTRGPSPDVDLSMYFLASRCIRNKFLLFISHPVPDRLLIIA